MKIAESAVPLTAGPPLDLTYPPDALRWPPLFPPECASAWGDDRHGLWIDVEISGVIQRFRWIEPGAFVMGSPDTEPEREDDEGPQHVVRLTEGCWLADTACSQALWQTLMGGNPSRFKENPQNPVEQVSWDDVQIFLGRLTGLLPDVMVELPTEAEWEYACRAGTRTAFSFGDAITSQQANYDGTESYAGGAKGSYRNKSLPVKSFVPNSWGLYQMHGNVWEWCADRMRRYDGQARTDSRGVEGGRSRALRGGSWRNGPAGLRSASRNGNHRGERGGNVGFRFSLRFIRQEGVECLPEAERMRDT